MPVELRPGRTETINGIQLYFEVHRTGEPLVLLHGFLGSSLNWMSSIAERDGRWQCVTGYSVKVQ